MKLSLSIITKGRADSLRRLLKSVKPVRFDEIVICDTAPGKGKVKDVTEKFKAKYVPYVDPQKEKFKQFCETNGLGIPDHISDFAHTRNTAFSHCSGDYICWLDSDDVLKNGKHLRPELEEAVARGADEGLYCYYIYSRDAGGHIDSEQYRERVVKNGAGEWRPFLHELYLSKEDRGLRLQELPKDSVHVEHDTIVGKSEGKHLRNLRILLYHQAKNGGLESRMKKQLGRAFMSMGMYENAIDAFQEHLDSSSWDLDHYFSLIDMAACMRKMGLVQDSVAMGLRAQEMAPQFPQAWASLAMSESYKKAYEKALVYAEIGIAQLEARKERTVHQQYNPADTMRVLYWTQFKSLRDLGRHTDSMVPLKVLLQNFPNVKDFKEAAEITQEEMDRARLGESVAKWLGELVDEQNDEKLETALDVVPERCKELSVFQFLKRKRPPERKPTLALLCAGNNPIFGPSSIVKGIGGSEEAAIHMAESLSKAGFYVDVFHNTPEEGEHGKGDTLHRWYPVQALRTKDVYDHVVVWRNPQPLERRYTSRTSALWMHDLPVKSSFPKSVVDNIDRVFVLSEFHKSVVTDIFPEEKITITRNGIHPDWLAEPENDPKQVIYASNPTRGLENLLNIFPQVHEKTGAKLHIFYGFTDWHKRMIVARPDEQRFMSKMNTMIKEASKSGWLENHGMVGHMELAQWFAKCGVWAYPTQFPEVSCITAMKAQAMGSVPVCTHFAALKETVQHGVRLAWEDGEPYPLSYYKDELIKMINDPKRQQEIRDKMVPWARKKFLWDGVAKQWFKVLEGFEWDSKETHRRTRSSQKTSKISFKSSSEKKKRSKESV